jgi:hypothetical protein
MILFYLSESQNNTLENKEGCDPVIISFFVLVARVLSALMFSK